MTEQYAVLDLGSNSFRLLVAQRRGEVVQIVERVKHKVQLVRDLHDGLLHPAAITRARVCLQRYAQRLAGVPRERIAVVGTHALRVGRNRAEVVEAAESIMGVPLRILSGEEEAAFVYRGVQQHEPAAGGERLVVDIGGGSTEFAWGGGDGPLGVRSLVLGCVSLGDRFFRQGLPLGVAYDAARAYLEAALAELVPVRRGVDVVGTSGTVESAQAVLVANGWGHRAITADGLGQLVNALLDGRWDADAGMLGLAPDRVDIFPAGVALLDTLFRRMGIASMRYVGAALEDGVLYSMIHGDDCAIDVRQATVRGLQWRFGIDVGQARRVRDTALALFDQAHDGWPGAAGEPDWRALLAAAAELHEIGLAVAPKAHHRHGAYLLRHADLQGFSGSEREHLALLVRAHRRRPPLLAFSSLARGERRSLLRLAALLRIAVILERSHADAHSPQVRAVASASADGDRLALSLPREWLDRHPLSWRELVEEPAQLAGAGIRLELQDL